MASLKSGRVPSTSGLPGLPKDQNDNGTYNLNDGYTAHCFGYFGGPASWTLGSVESVEGSSQAARRVDGGTRL